MKKQTKENILENESVKKLETFSLRFSLILDVNCAHNNYANFGIFCAIHQRQPEWQQKRQWDDDEAEKQQL